AGGWSKMSDEPLARGREPIERVRARLEALVMANAAPRCGARSKRTGKPCRAAAMPNGLGEVEKLIEAARKHGRYGHRDATMILLAYRHGLRASELCDLQWHQIEINTGRLQVRRSKKGTPPRCIQCRATKFAPAAPAA